MNALVSAAAGVRTVLSHTPVARRGWLLGSALVLGLGFYLAGHDWRTSLAEAYTQSAEEMELAAEGGNTLRRAAFLLMAGWGMVVAIRQPTPIRIRTPLAVSQVLLLGWAALSFLWADDPGLCLRRLLVLGCAVVAAAGLARTFSLREWALLALLVLGALAGLGVVAELSLGTFRPWDPSWRFAGTVHPNTQGPSLAAVCLACWSLGSRSAPGRWGCVLIGLAALGLMLATRSRTTVAALLFAASGLAWVYATPGKRLALALGGGLALSGGLWTLWVCGLDPRTDFRETLLLGRVEESDTLSGRAYIWPAVWSFISERPWLGYGYEAFWTPGRIEAISQELGWGLREAHNAYLEVWLWLGGIGLAWLLLLVLLGLAIAAREAAATPSPGHRFLLGMLLFGLVNAALESGMVSVTLVPFLVGVGLLRMAWFAHPEELPGPWSRPAQPWKASCAQPLRRPGPRLEALYATPREESTRNACT